MKPWRWSRLFFLFLFFVVLVLLGVAFFGWLVSDLVFFFNFCFGVGQMSKPQVVFVFLGVFIGF